jgi:hypothetical protein
MAVVPEDYADRQALLRTLDAMARRMTCPIPEVQRQGWEHLGTIIEFCLRKDGDEVPSWALRARDIYRGRIDYHAYLPPSNGNPNHLPALKL